MKNEKFNPEARAMRIVERVKKRAGRAAEGFIDSLAASLCELVEVQIDEFEEGIQCRRSRKAAKPPEASSGRSSE